MVPIFHDAANPSGEVLAEEARILQEEGHFTVAGRYFSDAKDAATARRYEAEKRVSERARQQRVACAFCCCWIEEGIEPVSIAGRYCHPACAQQFADWMDARPSENDPRWNSVTDETIVTFDGEPCTLGSLSSYERKTLRMQKDGHIVGGFSV